MHGFGAGDFVPNDMLIFLGLVPLLLFNYVGFELQNGAAEEMQNPQRDVPVTVVQSGIVTVLAYSIPIFGILAVLPASQITGIGGFLDAVHTTFGVYGGAQNFMTDLMALGFIFALVTSGSVWMMGSDRILAVAAYDGAFPGYFGRFHPRLGTPVRVNVMSGVVSTIFMLAAVYLLSGSASAASHVHRRAVPRHVDDAALVPPDLPGGHQAAAEPRQRASAVPAGRSPATGSCGCARRCTTAWMLLGSWVAIFPGTLEELTGHSYSMMDSYGVSRIRFEVFTLGTLAVVLVFGVVGYILAAAVRAKTVDVPLESRAGAGGGRLGNPSLRGGRVALEASLQLRGRPGGL